MGNSPESSLSPQTQRGTEKPGLRQRAVKADIPDAPRILRGNVYGCISFPFKSTALRAGRDFANRAARISLATDDGDVCAPANGKWNISTRLERKNDLHWFLPVVNLVGLFGEPEGPTKEEWRIALQARRAWQNGLDWDPANLLALPPPPAERPQMQMSRRRKASLSDIEDFGDIGDIDDFK
jgi:hypothetical protein